MPRRNAIGTLLAAACMLLTGCGSEQASASRDDSRARERSGTLQVVHRDELGDGSSRDARAMRASKLAESVAAGVNASIRLPRDVTIVMGAGTAGPSWNPMDREISLPWSFASNARAPLRTAGYRGEQLEHAVTHVVAFALIHEVAHMLIDELQLPIVGREEDAADAFSTVIAASILENGTLVEAAADYFAAVDAGDRRAASEYFAAHSLSIQRANDVSCLVYGSDPTSFRRFADRRALDEARRAECPDRWQQASASWYQLLQPHLRAP